MVEPLITARGLSFRYDDGTAALDSVDLDLHPNECVALLGPNGGGKTTLLLSLIGVLRAAGQATISGLPLVPANFMMIRKKIGLLFQDPDDQLFLPTVLEDVAFGPSQSELPGAEDRARKALALVGISSGHHRPPYLLSAGEKQRVALAGLIAAEPEILILDEPTTHLDPPSRRQLIDILRGLPQAKILVTHDVPFALALASRAVFLDRGRVAASGPLEEILRRFDWDPAIHKLV